MKVGIYTSANLQYLPQAAVLAESIKRNFIAPGRDLDIQTILILNEESDRKIDIPGAYDRVHSIFEIGIENIERLTSDRNIVELATAVKPFAWEFLKDDFDVLIYLDPDSCVYSFFDELFDRFPDKDVVLTPHQCAPSQGRNNVISYELEAMRFGVFNLGFLFTRVSERSEEVVAWWKERCLEFCYENRRPQVFTDQKFFDLAPAFFETVGVCRHAGYNLASWNLQERRVTLGDELLCNGQPLRFAHYTKANQIGAAAFERGVLPGCRSRELFFSYKASVDDYRDRLSGLDLSWSLAAAR